MGDGLIIPVKALAAGNKAEKVAQVSLLGGGRLPFQQTPEGLNIQLPEQPPCKEAFALKIEGAIV
ncbi:hypothetical protein [Chitinophaga eiseniae]|uniref:hypothetical protein n=1 Tax=Chitinophaga eiseniae TaxID=634771 RepID=UPI00099A7ABB|nr:hypothetical protein [Chitinophaga eiseniae]